MADAYSSLAQGLNSPPSGVETVTKSDTVNLTNISRKVWVGGAGNLAVVMADGSTGTIAGVAAGTMLEIRIARVNSTNTTATLMLSFY